MDSLKNGYQAMVFVHSRKDTVKTAEKLVKFHFLSVDIQNIINCMFLINKIRYSLLHIVSY